DGRLKEILDRGALRVGVQGAFKPWSFPAADGTMQGIEVDLGKDVAEKLGVKFEPVIITSANRMQFLQQSKIDLIIGGMYDTADLEEPEWAGYEMPVPVLLSNPWAAAVPIEEVNKGWGAFMAGMAYRWQASGKLLELAAKWKIKPAPWFQEQHEKLRWDTGYL